MNKNGFLIIFIIIFLIAFFLIFKLDTCKSKFSNLKEMLSKNTDETKHLLDKVTYLSQKKIRNKLELDNDNLNNNLGNELENNNPVFNTVLNNNLDNHLDNSLENNVLKTNNNQLHSNEIKTNLTSSNINNNDLYNDIVIDGNNNNQINQRIPTKYFLENRKLNNRCIQRYNIQNVSNHPIREYFENPNLNMNNSDSNTDSTDDDSTDNDLQSEEENCHNGMVPCPKPFGNICYDKSKGWYSRIRNCPSKIKCKDGSIIKCKGLRCYNNSKYFCPQIKGNAYKCNNGNRFHCIAGTQGCYDNSPLYCDNNKHKINIKCSNNNSIVCNKNFDTCYDYSPSYCYNFSEDNPKTIKCDDGYLRICPRKDINCKDYSPVYCNKVNKKPSQMKPNSKQNTYNNNVLNNIDECYKQICMPYKHLLCNVNEGFIGGDPSTYGPPKQGNIGGDPSTYGPPSNYPTPHKVGGCRGTQFGCCPDGITPKKSLQDDCGIKDPDDNYNMVCPSCPPCKTYEPCPECPTCVYEECPDPPDCPPPPEYPDCEPCPVQEECSPCPPYIPCKSCPPKKKCNKKCPEMICPPCPTIQNTPVIKTNGAGLYPVYPQGTHNLGGDPNTWTPSNKKKKKHMLGRDPNTWGPPN